MGELKRIEVDYMRPTQDYLRKQDFDRYLKAIRKSKLILPVPAVESYEHEGFYLMLDGHHRGSAYSLIYPELDIWVPDSPNDGVPLFFFPRSLHNKVKIMNLEIRRRFNSVQEYDAPKDMYGDDITSLSHLIDSAGVIETQTAFTRWGR